MAKWKKAGFPPPRAAARWARMFTRPSDSSRVWGDYYVGGFKRRSWPLEVLHSLNQSIPTFSELFDEVSATRDAASRSVPL